MDGNSIPVNEGTAIIVKASGDLFLEGSEQNEVRFQSSEDRIRVHQSNETLYVETHASMDLTVPRHSNVIVEKVGGSALLQDLSGSLVIQKIGGDLALQRLANVRIDKVGGGCLIEDVSDGLAIGKVGGDLTIRAVSGLVDIGSVGGDGDLQVGSANNCQTRAGGDIRFYVTESLAGAAGLRAGGNVDIFLPSNLNANFVVSSSGETILLDLSRQAVPVHENLEVRRYEFQLGEGGAQIEAQAGGDILVTDRVEEARPITDELERREGAWKEARDRRGSSSWTGGFGFDRTSAWADMISRRAQEASRRAEQRAQAAMRRTEEQIRRAAERDVHWSWPDPMGPVTPPGPPAPPVEPVTDQERLMVLQMLKDGRVTVEQAEKLLAALEGRAKS